MSITQELPDFLTVDEYAAYYRISTATVYRLIRDGKLPGALRLGGQWRLPVAELERRLARPRDPS